MMNRNEKLEIAKRLRLSTESELSRDDLEQMLDAELNKPKAEMDTELVQQILEILEESPTQEQQREAWQKTSKRLKFKQWQPVVSGLTRIAAVGVILVALMFATYGTAQALNWEFLLRWMRPGQENRWSCRYRGCEVCLYGWADRCGAGSWSSAIPWGRSP